MNKWLISFIALCSSPYLSAQSNPKKDLNQGQAKVVYSTKLDFDSTMIDGSMRAPMGFFLQGRNKQSLSNMVKLRSNFKEELRRSKTAVKAAVR